MNVAQLRKQIDDATYARDFSRLKEFKSEWESLRNTMPQGYWPTIDDRLSLLESYERLSKI
jgi:hypothetical protein